MKFAKNIKTQMLSKIADMEARIYGYGDEHILEQIARENAYEKQIDEQWQDEETWSDYVAMWKKLYKACTTQEERDDLIAEYSDVHKDYFNVREYPSRLIKSMS